MTGDRRIARNTMLLYLRIFFVMIVSIYMSRVVLNSLGVSDYGIYSVVAGFVSLFGFLNATLAASIQRFYNFETGRGNSQGIASVYTVGIVSSVCICAVLLVLLESFGLWYINNVMVVPPERLYAANVVFQTSVLSMVMIVMQIPFVGAVLAYERMGYYSVVSIIEVVLKLCAALAVASFCGDRLVLYSLMYAVISLVVFVLYMVYSRINFTYLHLCSKPGGDVFRAVLSFSGWNMVGTFSFIVNTQGTNMLLNSFFGPAVNAAQAISCQVSSALSGFTQSITMAFRPQVVESYARDDSGRVQHLFHSQSKLAMMLTALAVVPVIVETDFILHKWLGPVVPEYTSSFTRLVLLTQFVSSVNPPIVQVAFATGMIRGFQTASSLVNISIIPIAWIFLRGGCCPVTVFVLVLSVSFVNQIVCMACLRKVFDYDMAVYILKVILPCLLLFLVSVVVQFSVSHVVAQSWGRLFIVLAADMIVTPVLAYVFVLSREERQFMKGMFNLKNY